MSARASWLLVLVAACGGAPRWTARSPDGAHEATVIEDERGATLRIDEEAHGPFDAVAFDDWRWTSAGPVVPVRTARGWHVWRAGELGPAHRAVGELADGGRRYAALEDDGWHLVTRGERGPAHESIVAGSVVTSEGHVAYVARDADGTRVVLDGQRGDAHRHVDRLGFAGKRGLLVYVAYDDAGATLVAGERSLGPYPTVFELVRASQRARWAAIVEEEGQLVLLRDGAPSPLPSRARALALSDDGARVGWLAPQGDAMAVWVDGSRRATATAIGELRFVPRTQAPLWTSYASGWRVVHDGRAGPRFDEVELVTHPGGRWGYVGRRQAGAAVVVDGEPVFRGEWAAAPELASQGWACVIRSAGARYVLTPRGRARIPRPFVDTLVLAASGAHWAIAVADEERHVFRVFVDGEDVAPFSVEALAANPDRAAARAQVEAVLSAHATGSRERSRDP